MDLIGIVLAVLFVVIGGIVYYNRDAKSLDIDADGDIDRDDAKAALKNAEEGIKEDVREVVEEAAEAVKEAVKKLPTKSQLSSMTKTKLEALGREFGVELDKRKKKDALISDLQAGVKKNNKDMKLK
jgi:hypothetical protein